MAKRVPVLWKLSGRSNAFWDLCCATVWRKAVGPHIFVAAIACIVSRQDTQSALVAVRVRPTACFGFEHTMIEDADFALRAVDVFETRPAQPLPAC